MENQQLNSTIKASGVVLTNRAIKRLKTFQDSNNELLKDSERVIADAICHILKNFGSLKEDEKEEVTTLLEEMAIVRYNIDDLACPADDLCTTPDFHT